MTTPVAIAASATPAAPSTPATPKNGAHTEAGQPPATDPKPSAKANTEPGAKPGETAAETRQRMKVKLRKLEGDGTEELELDDVEIGRYVQKARVADKTRAADEKARQEWQSKIDAALKDPVAFFREQGVDLVELGRQEAARAEEMAKLDPVQRELAETRQKLQQYEAEKAKAAQDAEARAEAEAAKQMALAEQQLYTQAIAASGLLEPLPPTATDAQRRARVAEAGELMRLYADVRELAEYQGVPLTPEQLAQAGERYDLQRFQRQIKRRVASPQWRARNMSALKEMAAALAGELDGSALLDLFSKPVATKLARAQLEAYRKNPLPIVAEAPPPAVQSGTRPPSRGDESESLMGMMDRIANR